MGARNELGAVLRAAQKQQPWHYALSGIKEHELTLASLIGMTTLQAHSLLLVCGLSKKCCRTIAPKPDVVAKSDAVAKPDAWKAFAIQQNLNEEYFYFARHKVQGFSGDERVYWVGIGCLAAKPSVNPKSQFLLFKTPYDFLAKKVGKFLLSQKRSC
jgi:hypothetical protein